MQLKEPVRCIHIDPKSKKTTVKFLMPHVAERMRKYGWRVEHVAKQEAPQPLPETPTDSIAEAIPEIPTVEFIETPEPIIPGNSLPPEPSPAVEEATAAKRKYTKAAPTKVTNK